MIRLANWLQSLSKSLQQMFAQNRFPRRRVAKRCHPGPDSVAAIEVLEDRTLLAAVVWDGGGDGTSWQDPLNWNSDTLPTAADDVTIDVAADPTIIVTGSVSINSLATNEAINFNSATFTVSTTADINAPAAVNGSHLLGGTWDTSGARSLSTPTTPTDFRG